MPQEPKRLLLICDSHPVQYKAPVYQKLECLRPTKCQVLYYTDCSVRGYRDTGFGVDIRWDTPLLTGYSASVINNERGVPLTGFRSLHGRGIASLIRAFSPRAVILSQILYEADMAVWLACKRMGIPLWLRAETQDHAFVRGKLKEVLRGGFYRAMYRTFQGAFYFGELNRQHLIRHGMSSAKLRFSPFSVPSPLATLAAQEKNARRIALRRELDIPEDRVVVIFSGKLIVKKNPGMILEALGKLALKDRCKFSVLFVGAGELAGELMNTAKRLQIDVRMAGFVNQTVLSDYYLAADILALPSRRMGETWGLVVNEALHAGCAVVMTNAVGCSAEFGAWERVRVISENTDECARAIQDLSRFERAFEWCQIGMRKYSVSAAAEGIAGLVNELEIK